MKCGILRRDRNALVKDLHGSAPEPGRRQYWKILLLYESLRNIFRTLGCFFLFESLVLISIDLWFKCSPFHKPPHINQKNYLEKNQ